MNNGWIKLHRKAQESEIWNDQNAWRIFEWLLMNVDYKTGKGTFGKKQISEGTGVKVGTVYKVVTRLQNKYSVLSNKSSQLYTEISVLNWSKYQQLESDGVSTVQETKPTAYKKSNTIKEYKEIKNIRIKESIEKNTSSISYLKNIPDEDVEYFVQTWDLTKSQVYKKADQLIGYCEMHGRKYKNYKAFLKNAISGDFKTRPLSEPSSEYEFDPSGLAKLKKIKAGFTAQGMEIPVMTDFEANDRRNILFKQADKLRN